MTFASTTKQVLDSALFFIEEYGWTQGAHARTRYDRIIGPREEKAACFCTIGALTRAVQVVVGNNYDEQYNHLFSAANYLRRSAGVDDLVDWNDHPDRKKEEVVAAFKAASQELQSMIIEANA
jgi:hypothetical protein